MSKKVIGPHQKTGRKPDLQRQAWVERFGLIPGSRVDHSINDDMMNRLSRCRSDEARRLILGLSERSDEPIEFSSKPITSHRYRWDFTFGRKRTRQSCP